MYAIRSYYAVIDLLKQLYVETQPVKGQKIQDLMPEQVHLAIQSCRVLELV